MVIPGEKAAIDEGSPVGGSERGADMAEREGSEMASTAGE